ncbi:MAG: hypothetical protein JWN34_5870 [Bryobacterales bacterium]|nr:hypothetical protein [Bryobacterales bacterium]
MGQYGGTKADEVKRLRELIASCNCGRICCSVRRCGYVLACTLEPQTILNDAWCRESVPVESSHAMTTTIPH